MSTTSCLSRHNCVDMSIVTCQGLHVDDDKPEYTTPMPDEIEAREWSDIGGSPDGDGGAASRLYRWTLDPATGSVREEERHDPRIESPTLNDALTGRPHRTAGDRAGDDGWLVSIATHDRAAVPSRLLAHDATGVAAGPVAAVHLPRRVPAGFHGRLIGDAR